MIDLYLRAEDEASAKALLPDFLDADGNWITVSRGFAIDPVGLLVDQPAQFDDEDMPVAEATFVPGWHMNIRLLDKSLAAAIKATGLVLDPAPATPYRVWA